MQMIDGLAALRTVVDDYSEALIQLLRLCNLARLQEQVTKHLLICLCGLTELRQAVLVLGNEDDVRGRLRVYVTKREHLVVFVDYVRGNVLADDLVENCRLIIRLGLCSSSCRLFFLVGRHAGGGDAPAAGSNQFTWSPQGAVTLAQVSLQTLSNCQANRRGDHSVECGCAALHALPVTASKEL